MATGQRLSTFRNGVVIRLSKISDRDYKIEKYNYNR